MRWYTKGVGGDKTMIHKATVEFSMWRWMEDATSFSYTFHFFGTEDEILKQVREYKDEAYNDGFEDVLAIITKMVRVL